MTNYASKELIERATRYDEWNQRGGGNPPEPYMAIVRSLTQATPLPDNWCEPAPDPTISDNLTVAGAAPECLADQFLRHLKADHLVRGSHIDLNGCCEVDWVELRGVETHYEGKVLVVESAKGNAEPKPEPRASSALLEAARAVITLYAPDAGSRDEATWRQTKLGKLETAIKAEEARGPSEIEHLRKRGPSEIEHLRKRQDEAKRMLRLEVAVNDGCGLVEAAAEAVETIRKLRKERDEATARAEKAEKNLATLVDVCRKAMPDTLSFGKGHTIGVRYYEVKQVWDALDLIDGTQQAEPPANLPSADSDDAPLREWLDNYDPDGGNLTTVKQDEAAIAELCRRALGGR